MGSDEAVLEEVSRVRDGLPAAMADEALREGRLTAAELDRLAIPRKTLAHRRKLGRLTPEQSDRLLRILRIIEKAEQTFANQGKASVWLRRPTTALAGDAPLDLLDTEIGARLVERLLGRIGHGLGA